jgi:uncharacterized membrane protein YkvA (DUF1232 family)
MSELNDKCLDTFPLWLRSLGDDVESLLAAASIEGIDPDVKRQLVGGVNYLFKSLDLIPDGIDDIGYLDDAFVVRIASSLMPKELLAAGGDDRMAAVAALAEQTGLITEFLGEETFERLIRYTRDLRGSAARGRSVEDIVTKAEVWREFAAEVRDFARTYESPSFSREEKNLIKLRAFFVAKLPK